jgi:hypothetical protein
MPWKFSRTSLVNLQPFTASSILSKAQRFYDMHQIALLVWLTGMRSCWRSVTSIGDAFVS